MLKSIISILTGNIVAQGLSFITTILVSRELGSSDFGTLSTLLGIQYIALQLSDFGISSGAPKFISGDVDKLKKTIIPLFIFRFLILIVASIVLFLWFNFFDNTDVNLILYLILGLFFNSIFNFIITISQSTLDFKKIPIINISYQLSKFLIIGGLILKNEISLYSVLISYSISFLFSFLPFFRRFSLCTDFKYSKDDFKSIINISKWVFLSSIAVAITMRIDVIMLSYMETKEAAGIYAVANQIALVFSLITGAINLVLTPKVKGIIKDESAIKFRKKVLSFWYAPILMTLTLIIIAPFFIKLFGNQYKESIYPLIILIMSYSLGFICNPLSLIFMESEKTHKLTKMNYIQLSINIIGNILLIPIFGIIGAAISTCLVRIYGSIYIIMKSEKYAFILDDLGNKNE